jgi:hypothetical protein
MKYIGGDIDESRAFKHILSIGFEIETANLVKLTELDMNYKTGKPEKILLNTDTTPANMSRLTDENEQINGDYDFLERQEEKLSLDMGKNETFYITNDMADTSLVKQLRKICKSVVIDTESIHDSESVSQSGTHSNKSNLTSKSKAKSKTHSNKSRISKSQSFTSSHSPISPKHSNLETEHNGSLMKYIMGKGLSNTSDTKSVVDYSNSKNKLYKYRKNNGEEYAIHFAYWEKANTKCSIFSDVEWVVTYYKPKLHSNIILDTFTSTVNKLLQHLDELEKSDGELLMKSTDSDNGEIIIGEPGSKSLYHMPNTNLNYLKINKGGIDTILNTIQMTFSANIEDIYFIMKEMTEDKLCSYAGLNEQCQIRLDYLNKIEYCGKLLIKSFNKKESTFKIITTEKTTENKLILRQIKNYIILILYKLYIYYNKYLTLEDKSKLFKSLLPLNVRHTNYDLYIELKKCLSILFEGKVDSHGNAANIPEIIKRIFIQPDILYKYLLVNNNAVRKGAFNIHNQLDKQNKHYGNPWYSLNSYFDFFENPIDNDSNRYADDTLITHDWLEFDGIDTLSTKMEIHDNVILVEFRAFPFLLKSYIFNILDPIEREEMNTSTFDIMGLLSVKTLKIFIEKYDKTHNATASGFKKHSITRKKIRKHIKKNKKTYKKK